MKTRHIKRIKGPKSATNSLRISSRRSNSSKSAFRRRLNHSVNLSKNSRVYHSVLIGRKSALLVRKIAVKLESYDKRFPSRNLRSKFPSIRESVKITGSYRKIRRI